MYAMIICCERRGSQAKKILPWWVSLNPIPSHRRHPEGPRFYRRAEGSRGGQKHNQSAPDPSLRLKNGSAQDDPVEKSIQSSN
jgi:hypothetical protein